MRIWNEAIETLVVTLSFSLNHLPIPTATVVCVAAPAEATAAKLDVAAEALDAAVPAALAAAAVALAHPEPAPPT